MKVFCMNLKIDAVASCNRQSLGAPTVLTKFHILYSPNMHNNQRILPFWFFSPTSTKTPRNSFFSLRGMTSCFLGRNVFTKLCLTKNPEIKPTSKLCSRMGTLVGKRFKNNRILSTQSYLNRSSANVVEFDEPHPSLGRRRSVSVKIPERELFTFSSSSSSNSLASLAVSAIPIWVHLNAGGNIGPVRLVR